MKIPTAAKCCGSARLCLSRCWAPRAAVVWELLSQQLNEDGLASHLHSAPTQHVPGSHT
jgi:hypothetical protein